MYCSFFIKRTYTKRIEQNLLLNTRSITIGLEGKFIKIVLIVPEHK